MVHVEVQGYLDKAFDARMFTYFYLIRHKYAKDVEVLALLTDPHISFRPGVYRYQTNTVHLTYAYHTYKVLDQKEEALLEKAANPFALAVLAAQYHLKSKGKTQKKHLLAFSYKLKLVRLLKKQGYGIEKINKLFTFIDFLITLPGDLEIPFQDSTSPKQTKKAMPLLIEESPTFKAYKKMMEEEMESLREQIRHAEEQARALHLTITNLHKSGMSLQQISGITNMPVDRVREILGDSQ